MKTARIVIGGNNGDEGKGTVVAKYTKGRQNVLNVLTNGEKNVWAHECPDGYVKAESPTKGKHWHQKSKIRMIMCVETGEVLNVNEVKEKDLYNHTKHAADAANGKRKIAGGFHWEWVD